MPDPIIDNGGTPGAPPAPQPQNQPPAPGAPATPPPADGGNGQPAPQPQPGTPPADGGQPATPPAEPPVAAKWADNWREELVGDVTSDEGKKKLSLLQRLDSPKAMYEKLLNQEKLISSGQLKKKLGDNPTPEELAEYRADNGIPESPDKYDLTLEDGLVVGEQDKPVVDAVLAELHKAGASQQVASTMLNTYFKLQEDMAAERAVLDRTIQNETTVALKAEWGNDYKPNINLIKSHLAANFAEEAGELLLNARLADGTPLASHPDILRGLANTARQLNPVATIVPGSSDPTGAINTELGSLQAMMGDNNSAYWKGPAAEKNQQRYRELLEAQKRFKK